MTDTKTKIRLNYTIQTKVVRVWEHFQDKHISGVGQEAIFAKIFAGWYVAFEGSYEALFFGMEEPDFKVGDVINIKFERAHD